MLFLGAGASVQFDKPTTVVFKKELQSRKIHGNSILNSFLNTNGLNDIEEVLQAMKEIREVAAGGTGYSYASKYLLNGVPASPEISDFRTTFQYLLQNMSSNENFISHEIFERYAWNEKDNNILFQFYEGLFELLTHKVDEIYVATTNYDQAIENFCLHSGQGYSCVDGFRIDEKSPLVWNKENFDKKSNTRPEKLVFLLKIHGSLNWMWDGSKIIKVASPEYNGPSGTNIYIAPTKSPKIPLEKEPFTTLLSLFEAKLLEADICIAIGYAFRDIDINEIFNRFTIKGGHLILISPNCRINYSKNYCKKELESDEIHDAWAMQNAPNNIHFIRKLVQLDTHQNIFSSIKAELENIE